MGIRSGGLGARPATQECVNETVAIGFKLRAPGFGTSIEVREDSEGRNGDHQTVTFANLKDKLQEKRQLLDNTTMIIIQGDERATHGQIVQIMDIARQVGVVDQIIATEPNRGR